MNFRICTSFKLKIIHFTLSGRLDPMASLTGHSPIWLWSCSDMVLFGLRPKIPKKKPIWTHPNPSSPPIDIPARETWWQVRVEKPRCQWTQGVWFSQGIPKYSFITWLAMLDKLSTMDIVMKWSTGVDDTCVLCNNASEQRRTNYYQISLRPNANF